MEDGLTTLTYCPRAPRARHADRELAKELTTAEARAKHADERPRVEAPVREVRLERGLTQQQLANGIDVHHRVNPSKFESGRADPWCEPPSSFGRDAGRPRGPAVGVGKKPGERVSCPHPTGGCVLYRSSGRDLRASEATRMRRASALEVRA